MRAWTKRTIAAVVLSCLLGGMNVAQAKTAPKVPDWAAMIECRTPAPEYLGFVLGDFQQARYKAQLNIKRIHQDNLFLNEYELPTPIAVYGYDTRRIVFTSSGVMAVVNERDPVQLAKRLGLEIAYQQGEKVLASKLITRTEPEPYIGDTTMWQEVTQDLSTVSSHPGKTLVGCSYAMKTNEE